MKKIIKYAPFLVILLVFINWFISNEIVGGDWPYFFRETVINFSVFPPAWAPFFGNGLGGMSPSYFLDQYLYLSVFISLHILQIPWEVGYKFFWFGGFIFLSIFSSLYLYKTVYEKVRMWQLAFCALLYTTNTYILMVVGGGQMGIALAYAIAPLVLAFFIKLTRSISSSNKNFGLPIVTGLVLSVQVMFDPRIVYLTMIAVGVYYVFCIKYYTSKKNLLNTLYLLLNTAIPLGIVLLLHASWILPLLVFKYNPVVDLGSAIPTLEGLKFLSFADFSQAFSLLHPNWPENIFGKVYFMRPEFIILPILAYSSLLFLNSKLKNQTNNNNMVILFFAVLGLFGAFLAKGLNPPFEEINIWMFRYVPGIGMFRDPTKFYLLIALSYSMLIPFSLYSIYNIFNEKCKTHNINFLVRVQTLLPNLFIFFTFLYLLFLIRPALLGELSGTFKFHQVPKEYIVLKDFISTQPQFFRLLWIPQQQRFGFVSYTHPSIGANTLFSESTPTKIIPHLQKESSRTLVSDLGIKYIIVPFDPLGEIFLKDRKYDDQQYRKIITGLRKLSWLKEVPGFRNIIVFEVLYPKDNFWLNGEGEVSYGNDYQTKYNLSVSLTEPTNLIFSENYNPYWIAKIDNKEIKSVKTKENLNSFPLQKVGTYSFEVYFLKDLYYTYGRIISIATLFILLGVLLWKKIKKSKR